MKLLTRTLNIMATAVLLIGLTGIAIAQDDSEQYTPAAGNQYVAPPTNPYEPPPINYGPNLDQMPIAVPPAPPAFSFPTGIPVGPGTIAPTFNPPGIKITIPFK